MFFHAIITQGNIDARITHENNLLKYIARSTINFFARKIMYVRSFKTNILIFFDQYKVQTF